MKKKKKKENCRFPSVLWSFFCFSSPFERRDFQMKIFSKGCIDLILRGEFLDPSSSLVACCPASPPVELLCLKGLQPNYRNGSRSRSGLSGLGDSTFFLHNSIYSFM